jgi:LysR family transcriptional regulator, low CO2-responsive transcriptional regulator
LLRTLTLKRMKDVTLRQLRFLAATARSGSLAAAAEELHLTAPAIAQQLRRLEHTVGLPLLERGPGGQRATEAGRTLVDTLTRIEAELLLGEDTLRSLRAARTGRVALGAVSTAKYFAPRVLASFQHIHPGVTVTLSVGNRDEVLNRLAGYEIDLAVMGRPPGALDVEQEVFGEHPYVLIAAPDHPLLGRRGLTVRDLAEETFLIREHGSGTRLHLDALFTAADLVPRTSMEIASNETIKQAVMAGLGLALISAHTVAVEVRDGRLGVLHVDGLPIRRHWLVVRMARRASSPATRALWDFFVRRGGSQLPDAATELASTAPTDPAARRAPEGRDDATVPEGPAGNGSVTSPPTAP